MRIQEYYGRITSIFVAHLVLTTAGGCVTGFLVSTTTTTTTTDAFGSNRPRTKEGGGQRRSLQMLPPLHAAVPNLNASMSGVDATPSPSVSKAPPVHDLQTELNAVGLGLCHGILHSSGIRRLSDLQALTDAQITAMGTDSFDRRHLLRVIKELNTTTQKKAPTTNSRDTTPKTAVSVSLPPILSTEVHGAFVRTILSGTPSLLRDDKTDLDIRVISHEHNIFQGRLFTIEQCQQLNRMAEYHAYQQIGIVGGGWTDTLYTLTAQHMHCKDIPGMLSLTEPIFRQLQDELYNLFPAGRIRPGTIVPESEAEPHLVKYSGSKAKGTALHTDNSKFLSITLNVLLSDEERDFTGGGTYIQAIDQTIYLKQGEMLIHLGDLEHAGREIESGVRRLLISFFACEWEEEKDEQQKH